MTGWKLIDPSEHTLDTFQEVLHKPRKRMETESADKGRDSEDRTVRVRVRVRTASLPPASDREAAEEVIRLLCIALKKEEIDEGL